MKNSLLLGAIIGAAVIPAQAQKITDAYLTWPSTLNLSTYVNQWNGGNGQLTINNTTWEDEEFFTSRVKPRVRFIDRNTQVYSTINDDNDKRCIYWVPIGDAPNGQFNSNAHPAGSMDGEVFSMWSYIDHYGDWTSPWGWAPGVFADAAHKNGVAVSGVAQPAFGTISAEWKSAFQSLSNISASALGKFLIYHGVDGLGYNSEWTGYAPTDLINMHNSLKTYMADKNPLWEVIWYAGTTDSGQRAFDQGVGSAGGNTKLFQGASMFLNYNWNNATTMGNSVSYAKSAGRNPFFIYAGMNMQGGEPKSGENYPMLTEYQYSIGLWGAHNFNMFWQSRNSAGSANETMQRTYINTCENYFGNAPRNPAIRKTIKTNRGHRALSDWAGLSSMMSARSALNWSIADEPFITYFNLGNGSFFNWRGERVSDKEWYNLGVQDYLPTWRWWFAPQPLQGNISENDVHMTADFVWDDAYMGGSCLQISGSATEEYLHLFKTNFTVAKNQVIRVIYKLVEGEGDVALMIGAAGKNATEDPKYKAFITTKTSATIMDNSLDNGWQVAELKIGTTEYNHCKDTGLGFLGLRFLNANNMKLLLGGIEFVSSASYAAKTPNAPVVTNSKIVENNFSGVSGKLFWKMTGHGKATGEPVYNSDVNTSLFKIYAKEDGGEPQFIGATTSWAGFVFHAPNTDNSKKITFGVSAVGLDYKAESAIVWGTQLSKGSYTPSDDISLSKPTIKPNEGFTIYYTDPNHSASNWALYNPKGQKVASANNSTELDVPGGLSSVAGYDLKVDEGTANERVLPYFVQVSSEAVGALPEIYTLSINDNDVTDASQVEVVFDEEATFAYTGRDADGNASRALRLNEQYIGTSIGDLGLQAAKSFSIAGWFRFDKFPDKSFNFFNVSNKAGAWPQNTWGWCWNHVSPEGAIRCVFRGAATDGGSPGELQYTFPNTVLKSEAWTHIAYVCEYADKGFRLLLYINGVKQESSWLQYSSGNSGSTKYANKTTDDYCAGQTYGVAATDDIYFGGAQYQGAAVDGIVDDFQIWTKAMTEEDVKLSMNGLDPNNLPDGLACLWDFESEPSSDNTFAAVGSRAGVPGYSFDFKGSENEGAAVKQINNPSFASGCPFLTGTAFPIETKATWTSTDRKTEFTPVASRAANEGEAGAAKVKFAKEGDQTITLTLENGWGSDSREYPLITVQEPLTAIGEVSGNANAIDVYSVDKTIFVEFGDAGNYRVDVYNAAGQLAASRKRDAVAGQLARINLPVAGVYVVRIMKGNEIVRTVKVANN